MGFPTWDQSILYKFRFKLPICNNLSAYFCRQDNLLGGQFWAMGRCNLLGGQSNSLAGQMPTQLTCYLPSCSQLLNIHFYIFLVPWLVHWMSHDISYLLYSMIIVICRAIWFHLPCIFGPMGFVLLHGCLFWY